MRVVTVSARSPAARHTGWSPLRLLLLVAAYTAPFGLLCLRLHGEMTDGSLSLDGSAVLIRFVVVGCFSLLLGRWITHWLRGG